MAVQGIKCITHVILARELHEWREIQDQYGTRIAVGASNKRESYLKWVLGEGGKGMAGEKEGMGKEGRGERGENGRAEGKERGGGREREERKGW